MPAHAASPGRCRLWLLSLLLLLASLASSAQAQEVCDNGLDDDGDGLTDLRDTADCRCASARSAFVPSLIANPSFELFSACPSGPSEMTLAQSWIQATAGTSDYLNTCGFVFQAGEDRLLPFPDGNGAAGAYIAQDYKEYMAVCLPAPLVAGRRYRLRFNIAASLVNPGELGPLRCRDTIDGLFPPVKITLFGAPRCLQFPLGTFNCPTAEDRSWKPLGDSTYAPVQRWGVLEIDFTPTEALRSLMLGAPCSIPDAYPLSIALEPCVPYFYYDNLVLNQERFFEDRIQLSAAPCASPPVLSAQINFAASGQAAYQWYADGAALPGAIDSSLTLPRAATTSGYQLRLQDSGRCTLSQPLAVAYTPRAPLTITNLPAAVVEAGTVLEPRLAQPLPAQSQPAWALCDGSTFTGAAPTFAPLDTGRCCIRVSLPAPGGCPDTAQACLTVAPLRPVFVPNIFTPNGDSANALFTATGIGLTELEATIYNRWGGPVARFTGVGQGWDGSTAGGKAPGGVYFYHMRYRKIGQTQPEERRGFVELIR